MSGAGRQHVHRDRIFGLFAKPLLEDLHGFIDVAKHAKGERQHTSRVPVLWSQRNYLAVARRSLLGPIEPVEQNAEVRVRVDVAGIDLDCSSIGSLRVRRSAGRSQYRAQIAVRIRVARIERNRAFIRLDCAVPIAG